MRAGSGCHFEGSEGSITDPSAAITSALRGWPTARVTMPPSGPSTSTVGVLLIRSRRARSSRETASISMCRTPSTIPATWASSWRVGRQATLVQFSTAFCAPCRPTRQILAQVADMVDGVTHVEIDAASRLDLVRRLRINSTPTILVLGPDGAIIRRAVGLPRKADVIAALAPVIPGPGPHGGAE